MDVKRAVLTTPPKMFQNLVKKFQLKIIKSSKDFTFVEMTNILELVSMNT